jgi:hypothetical protein
MAQQQQQTQGSSFGGALGGGSGDNIPIVMGGGNVIPMYPPDSNQQQFTHGVATLAGFELWVSPKPNIYQDGMVNAFVLFAYSKYVFTDASGEKICESLVTKMLRPPTPPCHVFPPSASCFDTSLFMKSWDQTLKLYNSPFDRGDKSCAFLEVRRKVYSLVETSRS